MNRRVNVILLLVLAAAWPARAFSEPLPGTEKIPAVKLINDPLEPVNRVFYGFNNVFFGVIINPITKSYRAAIPAPVRKGIGQAGNNIEFPVRFINCLLTGRFRGAAVETGRFTVNSTVGLFGLFDPASRWRMKPSPADFGKTFAKWGAGWGFYLVMPIFGGSSFRDTVGGQLDSLLNPASYIFLDTFFQFNDLSFTMPLFEQLDALSMDPYSTDRDLWALRRKSEVLGLADASTSATGAPITALTTLGEERLHPRDPKFFQRAGERSVRIEATGKKLPYSFWLQPGQAPLVFVLPESGGHRLADPALATAEMAFRQGFSAVTISSPLNWEFIEKAGTPAVAGYPPADARDVHEALKAVYRDLEHRYPGRMSSVSLMGTDLGGVHALLIADQDRREPAGALPFRRIVAINPPADPFFAMLKFEEFYRAPLGWSPAERHGDMERALLKAVGGAGKDGLAPDNTEARYLIGWTWHRMLRDLIYASQKKQDLGLVRAGFGFWKRQPDYEALEDYSCLDYIHKFLVPSYQKQGGQGRTADELIASANLRVIGPALAEDPRLRVFANRDDFTLASTDLEWMGQTLGGKLTVFPEGGHLGNLHQDGVQARIMQSLQN